MSTYRGSGTALTGERTASVSDINDAVDAAEEWANNPENVLVSTKSGGDGVDDYSALHWSTKATASAAAALASETAAASSETATAADVVSTNADVITTNADAATTTQDAIDTAADVALTNADVVSSAASAAAALVSENNAATSEANLAALETAIDTSADATAITIDSNEDISYTGTAQYAAGEGVVFNGDVIAAANTLDDYEEGTWTPTIQDSSASDAEGQTYTEQVGHYRKIGDTVHIWGEIFASSIGTLTGTDNCYIAGLPFASNTDIRSFVGIAKASGLVLPSANSPCGYIAESESRINLRHFTSTSGDVKMTVTEYDLAGIHFYASYRV